MNTPALLGQNQPNEQEYFLNWKKNHPPLFAVGENSFYRKAEDFVDQNAEGICSRTGTAKAIAISSMGMLPSIMGTTAVTSGTSRVMKSAPW